jgi:acyl-CoA thioesterase I
VRRSILASTSTLALLLTLACRGPEGASSERARTSAGSAAITRDPSPPAASTSPKVARREGLPRIVILGDSLTAGLGLPVEQSFPSLIQERLDREGYEYEVVNAGVSGDTSAGGLRRLEWSLEGNTRVLVVALGGNDGLRGLPVAELKKNLSSIIERGMKRGLTVVLAGMEAPPNNGPDYTTAFRQVYADLAKQYRITLVPFLLLGVAGDESYNQPDGIHPNARGARVVADTVWRALESALSRSTHDPR